MTQVETFSEYRPLLFAIAYRMLGSVADAEDAVQETYLRWQANDDEVRSPKSYLSTIVTRLCIDELKSARAQREQYAGPWLPEPIVTEETPTMDDTAALADSLSMAFLVVLETLTPVERAVFLLREVFDYDYAEIASMVDRGEANCRQIARRSRDHVKERHRRFEVESAEVDRITRRFVQAATEGDMDALLDLLAEDAVLWSDGGGKVAAALNPIEGADRIARFFVGLIRKAPPGLRTRFMTVNGQPGLVNYIDGHAHSVAVAEIDGGRLRAIRIVSNPDKLRRLPPLPASA